MKKTLLAVSLLAAFGAASAESTITLSGFIDASIGQIKETKTTSTPTSTLTSVTTTTSTAREGAGSGLSSSRFVIGGSEDLGAGLKGEFKIEQALDIAQGGGTAGRNTWVGLSGGFGALTVGRQDTPFADAIWGVTDMDSISAYSLPSTKVARATRSIKYASPTFGGTTAKDGFQVRALVGSDTVKTDDTTTTATTVTSNTSDVKNSTTGLSLAYAGGPLSAGIAMNSVKGTTSSMMGTTSMSSDATSLETGFGLSYDFNMAKVFFSVWQQKDTGSTFNGAKKTTDTMLNVMVPFGAAAYVTAGVGRNKTVDNTTDITTGQFINNSTSTGNNYVLGAGYKFSPRTELYVRYAKKGTYNIVNAGTNLGSGNTQSFGLGVRHKF